MEKREGKRVRPWEVRALFEPNRVARECLADAYEHVVPVVRRRLQSDKVQDAGSIALRRAGGSGE